MRYLDKSFDPTAWPRPVDARAGRAVSVKDFGAVGDGVADDYAAIAACLAAHKRVHFPAGHYKIGKGLRVEPGAHLTGDGRETLIENLNTNTETAYRSVFLLGDHHPAAFRQANGTKYPAYAANALVAGAGTVTTATAADAGNFAAGEVIWVADSAMEDQTTYANPYWVEACRVVSADAGTGVIAVDTDWPVAVAAPLVMKTGTITRTFGSYSEPYRFADRVTIDGFRLKARYGFYGSAVFESVVRNLWIEDCAYPLTMNAVCRTLFENIHAQWGGKAIEIKSGSHDSTFRNVRASFKAFAGVAGDLPLNLGEGAHNLVFENVGILATGTATTTSIDIGMGYGHRFQRVSVRQAGASAGGQAIYVRGLGAATGHPLGRLVFRDSEFDRRGANAPTFHFWAGYNTFVQNPEDVLFDNCRFRGTPGTNTGRVGNTKRVRAENCEFDGAQSWHVNGTAEPVWQRGNVFAGVRSDDTGVSATTAANLALATHAANAIGKFEGKMVYDTTNDRPMFATGAAATSPWKDAVGGNAITPA